MMFWPTTIILRHKAQVWTKPPTFSYANKARTSAIMTDFVQGTMNISSTTTQRNDGKLTNGQPRNSGNGLPPQRQQFPRPPTSHQTSTTEAERRRQADKSKATLDIFADPPETRSRDTKPRRNSESSVRDRPNRMLSPEDEKRRRERKAKDSLRADGSKSKKPSRKLDVIDKLDVTSIYGTGCKLSDLTIHGLH